MTIKIENGVPVYYGDTFKITLIRYSDPDRLNAARNAARYLGKKDITNIRRPLSVIRMGHVPAIFRGEMAEFEFDDVSKEVYDHLVTYSTANMRVAGGNRALKSDGYTMPSDKVKDAYEVACRIENSMEQYHSLLENGETPQVARSAMPVNAKMNTFVYQFNFLTLGQHVFKQRVWEKGAQGNTEKVVRAMFELCNYMDKDLWETFYQWFGVPAAEWIEVRRKISKEKLTVDQLMDVLAKSKNGALVDKKGNKLHECAGDDSAFEALRKIYGEQHSMW